VDLDGWLTKEGRFRKSWKRRWFVLRGLELSYYDDHAAAGAGAKPKGALRLGTGTKCEPVSGRKDVTHCLAVLSADRKLLVQADTANVARAWCLELNRKAACADYIRKVNAVRGQLDRRVLRFFVERASASLELAGGVTIEAAVAVEPALRYHDTLKDLRVTGTDLGDLVCSVLAPALEQNGTVERLDLSRSGITDDGARALAKAIAAGAPALAEVDLTGNDIGEAGCVAIAEAVASRGANCAAFRALGLGGNKGGDPIGTALAATLALSEITVIDLQGNGVGDAGCTALAEAIAQHSRITLCDLSDGCVGDVGAQALARSLAAPGSVHAPTALQFFFFFFSF
jgi:hypothetical protein